jgi:hypothetical protein
MKRWIPALCLLPAASPVDAQHRFEIGISAGVTFSEGFETETFQFEGQDFYLVDARHGFSYGASFAYLWRRFGEIGFRFNQQWSEIQIDGGIPEIDLVDLDINSYHGYGAYHFGRSEAQVQPHVLFGLGATQYAVGEFQAHNIQNETKLSTIWGGGVKVFPGEKIGLKLAVVWIPTYINTDSDGIWCDPYWGCFVTRDPDYSHQLELALGVIYRL